MKTDSHVLVIGSLEKNNSYFIDQLNLSGYRTLVFEKVDKRNTIPLDQFKENLVDETILENMFTDHKIEVVVYFSSVDNDPEESDIPAYYYANNFVNTITLLNCMHKYNVRKLVYASSLETYGIPVNLPIKEGDRQMPLTLKGKTKLMAETLLKDYDNAYGIKHVILRYGELCNTVSEIISAEQAGINNQLVNAAIRSAFYGQSYVTINGYDHPTPDGTFIRDYIHYYDVANAFTSAVDYIEHVYVSNEFNLGINKGYSVAEVIACVERSTGSTVLKQFYDRGKLDPTVVVCNSDRAKLNLNWLPKFDHLEKIVHDLMNEYSKTDKKMLESLIYY